MMSTYRPCEAWTKHRAWWGRLRDLAIVGHVRHECAKHRPFAHYCAGRSHRCERCGLTWPEEAPPMGWDEYDHAARAKGGTS